MIAINNIVKGIGNFINYVNEVADRIEEQARLAKERADERQAEMREEGEIETPGGRKANFGFSFRTGILGNPPARTRPTPRPPSPYQSNRPAVTNPGDIPTREPMMDVFDETDSVLVVAELPGVAEKDIIIEIHEDILILRATGKTYHYEKECLLPATVDPQSLNKHYKNGMLELRLKRVQPPVATESDE
jgi:HSP20 family protein